MATGFSCTMPGSGPGADLRRACRTLARLQKEIAKLDKEVQRLAGKLGNDSFTAKAPADVVAKEREKLAGQEHSLSKMREQYDSIAAL